MKIESTSVQNLAKDGATGIFYARVKINQRTIYRSLETTKLSTAKLRLADKLTEIRTEEASKGEPTVALETDSTFDDAFLLYKNEVNEDTRLAPATKEFRLRQAEAVRRVWPEVYKIELRKITSNNLIEFLRGFEGGKSTYRPHKSKGKTIKGDSPTVVNAIIGFFRRVLDFGVRAGVIGKNPSLALKRKRPNKKLLELPTKAQFAQIVQHIRSTAGHGRKCADLVEGLTYTGMRLAEAGSVLGKHLDFEREFITVHGTKTAGSARMIPMNPAFKDLYNRMKEHRNIDPELPLFQAKEASQSLAAACEAIGRKKMTHHDLRHLFATTCIESDIDIPTVAKWLGHADGGTLAMKTYGHIRLAHSKAAAAKVSFAPPAPTTPVVKKTPAKGQKTAIA